jgi:hypothetical protein
MKEGICMSIVELMERAKISASKRTKKERKRLLIEAKIITKNGTYNSLYFSKETVEESKNNILNVH